jgi:hypothetical protein
MDRSGAHVLRKVVEYFVPEIPDITRGNMRSRRHTLRGGGGGEAEGLYKDEMLIA